MNEKKGTSTLIEEIINKANSHYGSGEISFVGLKYQHEIGWVAKIKFSDNRPSLTGLSSTFSGKALRRLNKRLDKIIDRYNMI